MSIVRATGSFGPEGCSRKIYFYHDLAKKVRFLYNDAGFCCFDRNKMASFLFQRKMIR